MAHGRAELVHQFLAAGAPAFAMDKGGMGPLVSAAENGDLLLVKQMMAGKEHLPGALLACALRASARSGNTELLEFLQDNGADVNGERERIRTKKRCWSAPCDQATQRR